MIILLRGSKQLIDRDNNASSTLFILLITMNTYQIQIRPVSSIEGNTYKGFIFTKGKTIKLGWYWGVSMEEINKEIKSLGYEIQ